MNKQTTRNRSPSEYSMGFSDIVLTTLGTEAPDMPLRAEFEAAIAAANAALERASQALREGRAR